MDRDDENNYQNAWLRRNYEKIKTGGINHYQEKSDVTERIRRPNKQEGKANKYSAIIQTITALSNSGLTQRKISELLSISIGSVNKLLHLK